MSQWQPQVPPSRPGRPAAYLSRSLQPGHAGRAFPLLLIAGAIAAACAGCSVISPQPSPAAAAAAAKPATCKQQYATWKTGPANAPGKKVEADAAALSSAGEDIKTISADLQTLGADATALQGYPMPKCADPAGYWNQYLADIKAAGDNASTATGLGGLILAEAPLKQVPAVQAKLTAELKKTTAS